jgi:exopolysaccharide biosynthesis polyprenyl glycosylphosphotransferase
VFFLLSAAPFLWYIVRPVDTRSPQGVLSGDGGAVRGVGVTLAAPFFLVVRALALGMGLLAGFLRFSLGWTLSAASAPRQAPISGLNLLLKRTLDIVVSVIGLVLAVPVLGVVGIAIKLDSPGPVFFIQERAGENGRPFRCIKLRTMVDGAEAMLPELVDLDALAASPAFKLKNDPRVTTVGHFLRRTGLDEVPQLWNVLKGEMSLVGPRPEEMRIVQLYNDWHRRRLAVKPGITGPMQVSGRGDLDLDERVRLELDYIHNYSIWKDLGILARTVGAVISGRGAY